MNYRAAKIVAGALALLLCASVLLSFAPATAAETVEYRIDLPPLAVPVSWAAAATVGDNIYVIGGCVGNVVDVGPTLSSVQIYNVETGDVTFGTSMPKGVSGAAYGAGPDGKIYIAGGWNVSDGGYYQRVQIYDPALDSWSEAARDVPSPIGRSASAMSPDGMLYVFGGGWTSNVTMIYNTQTDVWRYGTELPAWGLDADAVVASPDQVFLIDDGTSNVRVYNPIGDEWSSVAPLPTNLGWASAVLARNGDILVFGGSDTGYGDLSPLSSVLRYSIADDEWEYSNEYLYDGLTSTSAVLDSYGRAVVLGGFDGAAVVDYVQVFLTSEVTGEYQIQISSPQDGSVVTGVVEVQVEPINSWGSGFAGVDLFVDGALYESRTSTNTTSFLWDTSGLLDGSAHTLMARGYNFDGSVVEDSVTVTVSTMTIEEQIAALQADIVALQAALALEDANVTALSMQVAIMQAKLDGIIAGMEAMGAASAATTAALNATLADLQAQLDDFQEQIDRIETKADTAGTYGIVTMVLVIIIIVLVALMLMLVRKKP
jgi:N-acetylneuraminic acid mutarotase/uncharacterized small protein (DUF1192 family)